MSDAGKPKPNAKDGKSQASETGASAISDHLDEAELARDDHKQPKKRFSIFHFGKSSEAESDRGKEMDDLEIRINKSSSYMKVGLP
jgi:hypothetical protein